MSVINITNTRQDLYQLISEDERENIEETLHLSGILEYVNEITTIDSKEKWQVAEEYNIAEQW